MKNLLPLSTPAWYAPGTRINPRLSSATPAKLTAPARQAGLSYPVAAVKTFVTVESIIAAYGALAQRE
ncbi:MAG TPA: hypothetical protein GXX67_12470 [Petrimonas sp.]|nr:hypothetical protein [Petrimonas sp.]